MNYAINIQPAPSNPRSGEDAPHPSPLPASGERGLTNRVPSPWPSPRLRGEGQGEGSGDSRGSLGNHENTERARSLRKSMTRAERKVWYWLRNRYLSGFKFRRQFPVGNFILDFYCPALQLCIEVDGGAHDTCSRSAYDIERSCELSKVGIAVVRVRNEGVLKQPDGTWSLIVDAVNRAIREREEWPGPRFVRRRR